MNVLSIDWDYFIDCTNDERVALFPDGGSEEIGIQLSTLMWLGRYATSQVYKESNYGHRELVDIGVKEKEYEYVLNNIVLNVNYGCKVMFADSHADIYDFIKSNINKKDKVKVYNIDHHSDCYNMGDELNCGNWANKLSDEGIMTRYTWVRGDEDDNINDVLNCRTIVTDDITSLKGIRWDLIFVCRSSVWSPPHLDKDFNGLYERMNRCMGLNFNPQFFVDRHLAITERLTTEVEVTRHLNGMLKETAKYNKENCDCTEILDKIKNMLNDNKEENDDEY